MSPDSTKTTGKLKEKITHRSWRRFTVQASRGCLGRTRQGAGREAGPGAHAFIGVHGWTAFGVPGSGWVGQFKQTEQDFGKFPVGPSKAHVGGRPRGGGVSYQQLARAHDSAGCRPGPALM